MQEDAFNWGSGYILEWMLSLDNLFVFHLVFNIYGSTSHAELRIRLPLTMGPKQITQIFTWWTFRIFFIFFCSGRGKGESEASGLGGVGGGVDFIENPRRGGGRFLQEGEGPRGREGVEGGLWNLGGGGLNIFFRGRSVHQVYYLGMNFPIAQDIYS